MVCGADLTYFDVHENRTCHYCGQVIPANAACTKGHFVCDPCHQKDAVAIIKHICLGSQKTDAGSLMQTIRSHPHFKIHGPEHHSLVPAVILTSLRNSGCDITAEQVITGIERGRPLREVLAHFLVFAVQPLEWGSHFQYCWRQPPMMGIKDRSSSRQPEWCSAKSPPITRPAAVRETVG
jgi:hypothetical protein